ncbi:uncharacterized protein LOC127755707 [Oryza glaberrima]|uniref:uncharacterized protein LOC127755707 n=1 Tax=Oryza glaberrima TaxID=4538 RepID=UPI00224C49A4|nr:uncharacterized protein LOC127755707 [Oryza glaberrima]
MGSLLSRLAELLSLEENQLQEGVRNRVRQFSRGLKTMDTTLRLVANIPRDQLDEQVRLWAHNVRMLSYDLEDVVDTVLISLRVGSDPEQADLEMLMRLVAKMNDQLFNGSVEYSQMFSDAVAKQQLRYVATKHGAGNYTAVGHPTHDPYTKAMSKRLIGIDGPRDEVIEMLSMGDQSKLKIVSIFGLGGLGKTTLAKAVYDKPKQGFQCRAFVTVGRNPDMNRVLRNILYYLDKRTFTNSNTVTLDEKQLINKLQELLQKKRYFIVIDDLWDMNSWNIIRFALPDDDYGSKVVTTTHLSNIARGIGVVYTLQPLSRGNSRKLLFTRLFDDEGKCLERQSAEATEMFLKKCGGVPLFIIMMASLLATKPEDGWFEMYNSFGFGNGIDDYIENTRRIFSFCYYNMPSHLRICLLYLSIFKEGYEINKCLLIWKWIAEGFIHEEQQIGLFELAEGYFNELINRNMIQPVEDRGTGHVIGCRVHEVVLHLVRSMSSEENFVTILLDSGEKLPSTNANRLALQSTIVEKHHPWLANVDMEPVRSFVAILSSIHVVFPSFRVLRVLALEDCKLTEDYTSSGLEHLGKLLHLRYLGLTGTRGFHQLPEEIGQDLKFLQTLDLYETDLEELPFNVGLLTQLLCLRVDVRTRVPTGLIGHLTSLQELWIYPAVKDYSMGAATAKQFVKDLGNLRELRVLRTRIIGWNDSMEIALVESLQNFQRIQLLELDGESYLGKGITWEAGFASSHHLRYLSLACMQLTRLPAWMNSSLLPNLSYLVVNVQFWQEKDMETLGRLPELCSLKLQSCNIRVVNIRDVRGDIEYFPKLRSLTTYNILIMFDIYSGKPSSSSVGIDAATIMPSLEYLNVMVQVRFLKDGDLGFDKLVSVNLPSLQTVMVRIDCSDACLAEVKEAEAALTYAVNFHPNHPTLEMIRYSEYKMVSSDQTQQVYAIIPITSTTSCVRQFGGEGRAMHPISSSLGAMPSLLTKLGMLLDQGCRLPKRVKDRMQLLKGDLEEVGTYLEYLSKVDNPHLIAKCWMKEVRELSFDIEDYIYDIEDKIKFVRHVHQNSKTKFVCKINPLKIDGVPRRLKWNQQIANMISEFRIYVQEAIERYKRYDLHLCSSRHSYVPGGCVLPAAYELTANLVIDGRTNKFIKWLANDRDQRLKVVSIVGSGGVGKTTIAKLFYTKFGGQFDCRAFIQVPQRPNVKRLFYDIISQVQQNNPYDDCNVLDLIDNTRRHLKDKRYLIIIDNLSAASVWDILNQAFPECTQRSRIITTTRIKDVALTCCLHRLECIFEMKPLEDDYSRKLFFNIIFGSESGCPHRFNKVSNKIVQICGGMPLAIIIIASLLASQPVVSMELWINICDSLSPDLWTESTSDGMRQVLNLCYDNLPHYLKTCLLYLNMYPEGYKICKDALVKTWVAEGFIDAPKGIDREKVAESYFDELVSRRFIQPIEIIYNDVVSSCILHDLVRDLIAYKSVEENFIVVVDCYRKNMVLIDKVRRLSLHFSDSKYIKVPGNIKRSQVRSLNFFGLFECMPSITDFKRLRVLNLQLFGRPGDITLDFTGISKLFQLTYLKIVCDICIELPHQMRGLQILETLDMDTKLSAVPWDVFNLSGLLHLHLLLEPSLLDWIGQMKTAIKLGSLNPRSNSSQGTLNNLQDIHLSCSTLPPKNLQRNMEALGSLLGAVGNLKTLAIGSSYQKVDMVSGTSDATIDWDILAPPRFLQRFEWLLHDCIFSKVPKWIGELDNLCILNIAVRELVKNGIDILRRLPALTSLSLNVHTASIEKVIFDKGGFSILEYLEFSCSAPWLKFESDAIPNLRKLKLGFKALSENIHGTVPIIIEHLPGLKEISVKISGGGGGGGDGGCAEFALTSAVRNHPSNPKINVQLVDWIFYSDQDKEHATPAMGITYLTTARDRNTASLVCRYWG